jgi:hypothetical protein
MRIERKPNMKKPKKILHFPAPSHQRIDRKDEAALKSYRSICAAHSRLNFQALSLQILLSEISRERPRGQMPIEAFDALCDDILKREAARTAKKMSREGCPGADLYLKTL